MVLGLFGRVQRMNETDIPTKTTAGSDELKARSHQLPPRLRALLIMVDGSRNVADLHRAASQVGAAPNAMASLLTLGLVQLPAAPALLPEAELPPTQVPEPERFRAVQKFMNESAVNALGLRAFFFTLKLERCSTCSDLRSLLPDYAKAVVKGGGEAFGKSLEARAREMLG